MIRPASPNGATVAQDDRRGDDAARALGEPSFLTTMRWLCLLLSLSVLIVFANRGFDLTDESYYLAWTIDPAQYNASIHPFGLPQHLIYVLFGRSLIALRLLGITALLGSGVILGWYLAEYYAETSGARRRGWMLSCALFALLYYAYWGLTPNYNLMIDVAAALIVAGSLGWALPERSAMRRSLSSALIGIGGCLAFFAKPTSAGILAAAVVTLLFVTRRRIRRAELVGMIATAGIACLVPLTIVIMSTTGIDAFVRSLRTGLSVLNFGNSIGMLPTKTVKDFYYSSPLIWISVTLAVCLSLSRRSYAVGGLPRGIRYLLTFVFLANMSLLSWSVLNGIRIGAGPWAQLGISCLCLVVTYLGYAVIHTERELGFRFMAPIVALLLLPLVIAFGSAISILPQTGMSLFALFTAALIISRLMLPNGIGTIVQAFAALSVPAIILWSSFLPHGLVAPLYRQSEAVRLPFSPDLLYVDPASKQYIEAVRALAIRERLQPNTPILDLSGGGPGSVLVLGGRAPFYPWIFQLFGQPKPLVEATWASLSAKQKSRAWIIGPIDPAFVGTLAVTSIRRRAARYRLAGTVAMPVGNRTLPLSIWKPASR